MGLLKSNLITLAGGVSTPTVDPTLALDLEFSSMTALPASITFTRASVGTYFDQNGVMQTALANAARFDHDPVTLEPLGLLLEVAATNLCLQSGQVGYASPGPWLIGGGVTIALNNIIAPDGTLTGTKDTGTGTGSFIRQVCPVTASTAYTFSFWAKKGTMTDVRYAVYDATNAAYIVTNTTNYFSQLNGDAWTRIIVNFTTPAGCISVGIYPENNVAGLGTIYLWGAQLELGSFPTSYIPTTTAAVPRAADAASMTGTNFSSWYSNPEGCTLFTDTTLPVGVTGGDTAAIGGASSEKLLSNSVNVSASGATDAFYTITRYPLGVNSAARRKLVALASQNTQDLVATNGVTRLSTYAANTFADNAIKLTFGVTPYATGYLNGTIAAVKFFNIAKTDAELIELTTP